MVSTRGMEETMKEAIVEIVRGVNESIVLRLDSMHVDMSKLTHRNEALMMFQNFAMGEFNKISNGEGTIGSGSRNGDQNGAGQGGYGRLTKFEFSKFNGEDVNGWLLREFGPGDKCNGQIYSLEVIGADADVEEYETCE
ncbi:hypothetical protein Tco_0609165 [Tanacetum coccineum]